MERRHPKVLQVLKVLLPMYTRVGQFVGDVRTEPLLLTRAIFLPVARKGNAGDQRVGNMPECAGLPRVKPRSGTRPGGQAHSTQAASDG